MYHNYLCCLENIPVLLFLGSHLSWDQVFWHYIYLHISHYRDSGYSEIVRGLTVFCQVYCNCPVNIT
jgi:hypothetical protein